MIKRNKKLLIHIESQRSITSPNGTPTVSSSPMFGIATTPMLPCSSPVFASPKRKVLIDKWHDKLKRVLSGGQSPTKTLKSTIQMQNLVQQVSATANVFPEEACCALVDSKYRKHMSQWVASASSLLTPQDVAAIVKDISLKFKEPLVRRNLFFCFSFFGKKLKIFFCLLVFQ